METINDLKKPDKVFTIEPITRHLFAKEISEYLLSKSLQPGKATICAAGLVLYNKDFSEMPYNQMYTFIASCKNYLRNPFTRKQQNAIKKEIRDVQDWIECIRQQLRAEPMKNAWYLGEQYNNYDLQKQQSYLQQLITKQGSKFETFLKLIE